VLARLKAQGGVAVCRQMAAELVSRAPAGFLRGTLVPVPAHPRRRRRHGFNQAGAIASALGSQAGLPVQAGLERVGSAPPQVGLERRARLANARGSVRARGGWKPPDRVVLVDDVYTTGATLDASAQAIKAAGASEVVAVTFARAIRIGT
jgi:predicted amidophosphoribosyltransferase